MLLLNIFQESCHLLANQISCINLENQINKSEYILSTLAFPHLNIKDDEVYNIYPYFMPFFLFVCFK